MKTSQANRGMDFEAFLKEIHNRYRERKIATMSKHHTAFKPIRDPYSGRVVSCKITEKCDVDYTGHYKGIPVAVEAKHSEVNKIRFDRVEAHQAAYLDDWTSSKNAVGLIVVSFNMQRFFAIPWPFWRAGLTDWASMPTRKKPTRRIIKAYGWEWETPGTASVKLEQLLSDWEIQTTFGVILPYLDVIDRMEKAEC